MWAKWKMIAICDNEVGYSAAPYREISVSDISNARIVGGVNSYIKYFWICVDLIE